MVVHSDHGVNFMGGAKKLLSTERAKAFLAVANTPTDQIVKNRGIQIEKRICEVRSVFKVISGALTSQSQDIDLGVSISESLYPGRGYEIAVRNADSVLFGFVHWDSLKDGRKSYEEVKVMKAENEDILYTSEPDPQLYVIADDHLNTLLEWFSINE